MKKKYEIVIIVVAVILATLTVIATTIIGKKSIQSTVVLSKNISIEQRKKDILLAYHRWKDLYVKEIEGQPDQYYVEYDNQGNTVSEAHGYGMLTMVMMASQFEENTKSYFDGMFHYAKDHPSDRNASFMVWKQLRQQDGTMMDDRNWIYTGSATDGDMDIAYALLLADKLWGSRGEISYKQEAITIIHALMDSVVNQNEWTLKLGDWVTDNESKYSSATRTSDWMIGHIAVFYEVTGDERWKKVLNQMKEMITYFQETYSPQTGLLPEFVSKKEGKWVPVDAYFLEGENDPYYYYNACRVPWRLAVGYFITKDEEIKHQIEIMNKWVQKSTQNNPSALMAGYELNGQALVSYSDMAFIAPFAAAAFVEPENREWQNRLWHWMITEGNSDKMSNYYNDSIRLLVMLFIQETKNI